jgi:dihydrofolate reductase
MAVQGSTSSGERPAIGLVWAQSNDGVIGVDGDLPWHVPEDLAHFRVVTDRAVVVMGHTTWRSLPARFRPLPGRVNVVLSRETGLRLAGARVVDGVEAALELAAQTDRPMWVIGGGQVYAAFVPHATHAEITEVDVTLGAGTRAPVLGETWSVAGGAEADWQTSSAGVRYRFTSRVRQA